MDIKDLLRAADQSAPTEFQSAFNDIMADKITNAIEARVDEVSSTIIPAATETDE